MRWAIWLSWSRPAYLIDKTRWRGQPPGLWGRGFGRRGCPPRVPTTRLFRARRGLGGRPDKGGKGVATGAGAASRRVTSPAVKRNVLKKSRGSSFTARGIVVLTSTRADASKVQDTGLYPAPAKNENVTRFLILLPKFFSPPYSTGPCLMTSEFGSLNHVTFPAISDS